MPNITDAVRQSVSDDAKSQALKWVGQAILASAGAGMGARGLLGLYNMHRNPIQPAPVPLSGVLPAEIPVPDETPRKKAADLSSWFGGLGKETPKKSVAWAKNNGGYTTPGSAGASRGIRTVTGNKETWTSDKARSFLKNAAGLLPTTAPTPGAAPAAPNPAVQQLKVPPTGIPTAGSMKAWNNLNAASAGLRAPPRPAPRTGVDSGLGAIAAQLGAPKPAAPAPQPQVAAKPATLAPTTAGGIRVPAGPAELSRVQQLKPASPAPAAGMLSKRSNALKFLAGDLATKPQGVPWALPATVFGGAAGAAGGWKLVDYLLDKRRRAEIDQDVQKAQTEFQSALQASYGPGEKAAEVDSLGADLDALYDQFQKTAGLADTAGLTAGVVGTGMGSLGMLAAIMSYQEASKRRKSVILNKAMNSWQRRMWRDQPPAVAVQPMRKPAPVIVPTQTDDDTEQR